MTVISDTAGTKDVRLTAEQTVDFHITDDQGKAVHGMCDKAVYTYRVVSGVTNDMAVLTGHPVLETEEGTVRNSIIILDRATHTISAPGKYKLYGRAGTVGGGTNLLQIFKKNANPSKR